MTIEAYGIKDVATVSPDEPLSKAAEALRHRDVGSVVAVEADRPVGMLTDRDLVMAVLVDGRDLTQDPIREGMQQPPITVEASANLRDAIGLMSHRGVRRLPIVDAKGVLAGLVSADDLVSSLTEELVAVRSVIATQSPGRHESVPLLRSAGDHFDKQVVTVPESATASDVARTLLEEAVGCAVVVDAVGHPTGMLTDRDLMKHAIDRPEVSAGEIMSRPLTAVSPDASLEHLIGLMRDRGVRRIPVVGRNELLGLVSLDDVLVAIGRELSDLGIAFRHAIARGQRDQRLKQLREEVHARVDWSIGRAGELGERAQDRLAEMLQTFRKELRSRLK